VWRRTDQRAAEALDCVMDRPHARKKKVAARNAAPPALRDNLLLAALPAAESRRLIARCEPVELTFGDILCEQGDRIEYVYLPTDSFISLLSSMDGRARLEVGLIGAEGMLGVSLILGVTDAPLQALVQGAGTALRMDAGQFSHALNQSPALDRGLKRHL
jgi:CRP-like cAMP-binding protein